MGRWVDAHCHLQLDERPAVELLRRARAAGVEWVMCPGTDARSSVAAAKLASEHPDVLWSAGLHPHDATQWPEQEARIAELGAHADAIGECGLDYYRDLSPRPAQRRAFQAQLALAKELGRPVIVHCRDAFGDVYEALESAELGPRAVLHCWTGGPRWTKRFRELEATFSFAGPIAFETGDTVRRGAAEVPPGRAMVETDTPYLSPPPFRGEANEPARVVLVGEALANVWGIGGDDVAAVTSETAASVFGR